MLKKVPANDWFANLASGNSGKDHAAREKAKAEKERLAAEKAAREKAARLAKARRDRMNNIGDDEEGAGDMFGWGTMMNPHGEDSDDKKDGGDEAAAAKPEEAAAKTEDVKADKKEEEVKEPVVDPSEAYASRKSRRDTSFTQKSTAEHSGSRLRSVLTDSEMNMAQKHVDHFDESSEVSINIDG